MAVKNLNWIFIILVRLTIGVVFIQSGFGKITNIDKVIDYFTQLEIPFAAFSAYLTAWTELFAGGFIFAGFLTRISSLALFIVMIVAIITTQITQLDNISDLLGTVEYLYAVMSLGLILVGAEDFSIDKLIKTKNKLSSPSLARFL